MPKFMTQEEIKAGIDSGDNEIINGYLSGDITIGENPKEGVQETVEDTVAPEEVVDTSKPSEDAVDPSEELKTRLEELAAIRRAEKYKLEQENSRIRIEFEEAKRKAEEYKAQIEKIKSEPIVEQKIQSTVETDDDDDMMESDYNKQTRKMIRELSSKNNGSKEFEEIRAELNALKAKEEERLRIEKENLEKSKAKEEIENRNKLIKSIEEFQSKNEHFKTKQNFKDLADRVTSFKSDVAEFVKAKNKDANENDIERAVHAIVKGTSEADNEFRKRAEKNGVVIPDEVDKFFAIADIIDLKNGYKFDPITGDYNPVVDSDGNQVTYKSFDEVIKLNNYDKSISEAKKEVARQIQKKINKLDSEPVKLDDNEVSDGSKEGSMTAERIKELLNMDIKKLRTDPALRSEAVKAYAALGIKPPASLIS